MQWTAVVSTMCALGCLGGCSFRGGAYVPGQLTALSVPSTASVGEPITVHAHAHYDTRYENPALSVAYPADGTKLLKLMASSDWVQPAFGWGVFEALPYNQEADVQATISFAQAGTYTVQGLNSGALPSDLPTPFASVTVVVN